jgi:DNA helicase-2/ATP-dependent DNA helicase PcrA
MNGNTKIVFGGPGTGKTTFIIDEIRRRFNEPDGRSFAYITFTRSSASDFKRRLEAEFHLTKDEIRDLWVGTQHSICLRLLGAQRVATNDDRDEFCKQFGYDFDKDIVMEQDEDALLISEIDDSAPLGNKAFSLNDKCRLQLREVTNLEVTTVFGASFSKNDFDDFAKRWKMWKEAHGLIDFVDMLEKVLAGKLVPPVKRLYCDEFQDYGALQYAVYSVWRDNIDSVVICGDDDQAIYSFLGASPKYMLNEIGEKIILTTNRRNAAKIYEVARDLIRNNRFRQEKEIICVSQDDGIVEKIDLTFSQDRFERLISLFKEGEQTFVLTRTNRQLHEIADYFDSIFLPYQFLRVSSRWTDDFRALLSALRKSALFPDEKMEPREYHSLVELLPQKDYIIRGYKKEILKTYEPLSFRELRGRYFKKPDDLRIDEFTEGVKVKIASVQEAAVSNLKSAKQRAIAENYIKKGFPEINFNYYIWVGTFHASKGLEKDTVFLVDSMPKKVAHEVVDNVEALESERRVYYVAITRAKKRLVYVTGLFPGLSPFLEQHH